MKLSKYRETYYEFSGKASDVARQLAFAGIALVWIFRIDSRPAPSLPRELLPPSCFLALALALDLLQYALAALIWGTFHRYHEKRLKDKRKDPELTAPPYFNWPAQICFLIKLVSVVIAYILIINYIWHVLIST
jgi:hypothetical protein